jgi:hypothetical protein
VVEALGLGRQSCEVATSPMIFVPHDRRSMGDMRLFANARS